MVTEEVVMPFKERSVMEGRQEFCRQALEPGANVSALCRHYGISRRVGYKWLGRYSEAGVAGLFDRSRQPLHSPKRTAEELEAAVLSVREEHPAWGGRKIARVLRDRGVPAPPPSTITEILRRHGKLDGPRAGQRRAYIRFERAQPNELWQMDFKGHFATGGGRCHPLTVLDDHSRYDLALRACADEQTATVQQALTAIFRDNGLPDAILCDNGPPWGDTAAHRYTPLGVWLMLNGVGVRHSRPYHPQTMGKDERFHRTLKREVLGEPFADLDHCQRAFDRWRQIYNHIRPHEALDMDTPASRYRPSPRAFSDVLSPVEYDAPHVRKVSKVGRIGFLGYDLRLPNAFAGHRVALRPTETDGCWEVFFATFRVAQIDLRDAKGACVQV
jgi:transposase InsO family protein